MELDLRKVSLFPKRRGENYYEHQKRMEILAEKISAGKQGGVLPCGKPGEVVIQFHNGEHKRVDQVGASDGTVAFNANYAAFRPRQQ